MKRSVCDVRIYPGPDAGFDVLLRVRGGIKKHGSFPTLETALAAARAIEGKNTCAPVSVYDRSFPELFALALEPVFKGGGRQ